MVRINENAEKVIRPSVDSSGRVTIGSEYSDRQVEVAVLGPVDEDANAADADADSVQELFGDTSTFATASDISGEIGMDYEHVRDVIDALKRRNGEYE